MSSVVLKVEGVSKSFSTEGGRSRLSVLSNIDLSVEKGEFLSIVGPSGCGKTTLLRMMVGLSPCEDGRIFLRDGAVDGVPENIGFVAQESALLPWRTVYENIELALAAKGWNAQTRREAINRYLEMTGLSAFASYPPYQLSGGMQRRVALARALVGAPDVLFLDEPFVALDALTRQNLQTDLAQIVGATHTTTVLITHDIEEALFLSDRVLLLRPSPGRVLAVVEVERPRPRDLKDFLRDPHVIELRTRILDLIEGMDMSETS